MRVALSVQTFFQLLLFGLLMLLFRSEKAGAQAFGYQLEQSPKIIRGGDTLGIPWGRGLNSPQIQNIDLNRDGLEDLLIYDRSGYDFHTFINNSNTNWLYDPRFESTLPDLNDGWIVVADADCDGVKDIYAYGAAGPTVYKAIDNLGYYNWGIFVERLFYLDSLGRSNLLINQGDYPSILDADGDGDTDILAFEWLNGGFLRYFKNMSMEINGNCDSMIYVLDEYCWGRFYECADCGKYDIDLDDNCLVNGTANYCSNKAFHAGSTSLHLDLNDDGLLDILLGDVGCKPVVVMRNKGTSNLAKMDSARSGFPRYDKSALGFFYPAMFNPDVDFDGRNDLIVVANTPGNFGNIYRLDESVWYYKDVSQVDSPNFQFQKRNFLQDEMYDVGEFSYPALADYDGDGDLDLFVGNGGRNLDGDFISNLNYLENTGDSLNPHFTEIDTNFLSLVSQEYWSIRPIFEDFSGDGITDMAIVAIGNNGIDDVFKYYENQGVQDGQMIFDPGNPLDYGGMDTLLLPYDNPHFADLTGDGVNDLMIGRNTFGVINYLINEGTNGNPLWKFELSSLGGIGGLFANQAANMQVADFNRDGNLDLAYGVQDGILRIYSDFIPGIYGTLQPYTSLVYNSLTQVMVDDMLGSSIYLAPGDLTGDGNLDFILGSSTGGLQFIDYDTSLISSLEPQEIQGQGNKLKTWPNPTNDLVYFEYPGHWENIQLLDLSGRILLSFERKDMPEERMDLTSFEEGIYLLRVEGRNGPRVAKILKSNR